MDAKLKQILDKALSENLSDQERGEIYAQFTVLYLETVNSLNRQYEKVLDDSIAILKDLNEQEKRLTAQK